MNRAQLALVTALVAFGAAGAVSCKADLESSCVDGTCTSSSSGAGGNGACAYPDTGGFPCDVYGILRDNCHTCHTNPPLNGAPFPLLTWDDTQKLYPGGTDPIWQHMRKAIVPGALPGMPYGNNPPGLAQNLRDVLNAWFATCDTGMCAQGHGSATVSTSSGSSSSGSSSSASTSSGSTSSSSASSTSASTGTGM